MRLEKCEQNFSGAGNTPRVTTDNTFRGNVGDPGDDLIETITRTGLTGADYTYSYDANKNKLKETINAPLANYGYGTTVGQEAAYDAEDRLTDWHRDDTLRDLNWVITKVGDFSSYSVEGVAETRTHTAAHELTNIVGGGNPGALAYDPKGNLTTRSDNFAFVWDFDNQLKEVTVPVGATLGNVGTHKYSYDALGRRVLKHVAGEKRLIFVHDGDQIIAEYKYTNGVIGIPGGIDAGTSTTSQATQTTQTTQTQDSAVVIGTRRGTATIQRKYMYTSYIDERCLMVDRTALGSSPAGTEELFYYHSNNLFSTGAMTDALGAVTERYAYDAYGQIVFLNAAGTPLATQASTIGQPYTFTGRRLDEETFLNHYRARYYDPIVMQRFIGRDRILYGDGYNMYAYVGGGPLDGLDPTGTESLDFMAGCREYLSTCNQACFKAHVERGNWFVNHELVRCQKRCTSGYRNCVQHNADVDIKKYLESFCEDLGDCGNCTKSRCKAFARGIVKRVGIARSAIIRRGGPVITYSRRLARQIKKSGGTPKLGQVCHECESHVNNLLKGALAPCFEYRSHTRRGIYDHVWGDIVFTPTGKVVVTIDTWEDIDNPWRRGENSFGHRPR